MVVKRLLDLSAIRVLDLILIFSPPSSLSTSVSTVVNPSRSTGILPVSPSRSISSSPPPPPPPPPPPTAASTTATGPAAARSTAPNLDRDAGGQVHSLLEPGGKHR